MIYYLHENGAQVGPYTELQISEMLSSGQITSDDLIWHQGLSDWKQIRTAFKASLPPISAPRVKKRRASSTKRMSTKALCILGCSAAAFLSLIFIVFLGDLEKKQTIKSFEKSRSNIIADMKFAAEIGNHVRVVEIGGPYESIRDFEFHEIYDKSLKEVQQTRAVEFAQREAANAEAAEIERSRVAELERVKMAKLEEAKVAEIEKTKAAEAERIESDTNNVGETVTLNDSEWTVVRAQDLGNRLPGNDFSDPKTTEGKFVYVQFKVKNNTNEEQAVLFTPAVQDAKGRRYEELDWSSFYLPGEETGMAMESLPAGLPKTFSAIFEMPKDAVDLVFLARNFDFLKKKEKQISLGLEESQTISKEISVSESSNKVAGSSPKESAATPILPQEEQQPETPTTDPTFRFKGFYLGMPMADAASRINTLLNLLDEPLDTSVKERKTLQEMDNTELAVGLLSAFSAMSNGHVGMVADEPGLFKVFHEENSEVQYISKSEKSSRFASGTAGGGVTDFEITKNIRDKLFNAADMPEKEFLQRFVDSYEIPALEPDRIDIEDPFFPGISGSRKGVQDILRFRSPNGFEVIYWEEPIFFDDEAKFFTGAKTAGTISINSIRKESDRRSGFEK